MSSNKNYSVLKFCEWASARTEFLVSIRDDHLPMPASLSLCFDNLVIHPFFPVSMIFSGSAGRLHLRYVSSIDMITENTYLIHCGRNDLPEVYLEFIVTTE